MAVPRMTDPCPFCGHSISDDHDEMGWCSGETLLGGEPPIHKSCSCAPHQRPATQEALNVQP